jgi:hypothetical protein
MTLTIPNKIATEPTRTTEVKETATATVQISNIFDVMQLDMPPNYDSAGLV